MTWKSVLFDKNSNDIKPHVTKMSKSQFFFFKYVYVTFVNMTFIKFIQMSNNVIIQFFIFFEMKNRKKATTFPLSNLFPNQITEIRFDANSTFTFYQLQLM